MCLSVPRIFGYFQGNMGLVRVKVAFEVGRSLLKRTEQGTAFQVEKTAWQSTAELWKDTSVFAKGWTFGLQGASGFGRKGR